MEVPKSLLKKARCELLFLSLIHEFSLFIPPMWYHHVTNIDSSISFNIFTEAPYHPSFLDNTTSSIQLSKRLAKITEEEQKLRLTKMFVERILQQVKLDLTEENSEADLAKMEVSAWLKAHWEERYSKLWHNDLQQKEDDHLAELMLIETTTTTRTMTTTTTSNFCNKMLTQLEKGATKIALNALQIPQSVLDLHLGDIVDGIAFYALNSVNNLYFLKYVVGLQ